MVSSISQTALDASEPMSVCLGESRCNLHNITVVMEAKISVRHCIMRLTVSSSQRKATENKLITLLLCMQLSEA